MRSCHSGFKRSRPDTVAGDAERESYLKFIPNEFATYIWDTWNRWRQRVTMMSEEATERTWYLKDEPLPHLGEGDLFRHRAYVRLLTQAINELKPPFTLGVFGSWGVGKTSIVNHLQEQAKDDNDLKDTTAVNIDVWKYEGDSLRRQFLWDLQEQLKEQKVLPENYDKVREAYEERAQEIETERFSLARLKRLAPVLVASGVATFLLLWLFLQTGVKDPGQALIVAGAVPLILYLIPEFSRNIVVHERGTITRPIFFSAEQFERAFESIVDEAKCEKLVIIVDNLDRCSHERVVETLGTVKTFLEPKGGQKCIFVIPCDDSAIRQHVKSAHQTLSSVESDNTALDPEEYADEYLRKFFSGSIRIDPFLEEEIEPYILAQLNQIKLAEGMSEEEVNELVQMVGALFRENPRRIKQYLNNLTSKYLLAQERESGPSPQINPPISQSKLFLAKVAAIEARFPSAYQRLLADDNLYREVVEAAVTHGQRDGEVKGLLDKDPDLENFLRTTRHVTADNSKAFFHLKQSPQEASVPNYDQFATALRQGDRETIQNAYREGGQADNNARTDIMIRNLRQWALRYTNYAINAIEGAVAVHELDVPEGKRLSQEVIGAIATTQELLNNLDRIQDPEAIFAMMPSAYQSDRRRVQNAYIELYSKSPDDTSDINPLQETIAGALVAHVGELSNDQKQQIRTVTTARENPSPALLEVLSSSEESKEAFVEEGALVKLASGINAEEVASFAQGGIDEAHFPPIRVLVRCQGIGKKSLADSWANKLAELLEHAVSQSNNQLIWYDLNCVGDTGALLDLAESEVVDKIVAVIHQKYQEGSQEQRGTISRLLWRVYPRNSEGQQQQTVQLVQNEFLASEPMEQAAEFLALHSDPMYAERPWDQVTSRLAERLLTGPETEQATEHLKVIGSKLIQDSPSFYVSLLVHVLQRPETQQGAVLVAESVSDIPKSNRGKGILAPLLDLTLSTSGHLGQPENRQHLLSLALQLKDWHTREFESKLDGHLVELITGDEPLRPMGMQTLENFRDQRGMAEPRYVATLQKLGDWLMEQPINAPLQAPLPTILDRIMSLKNAVLNDDSREEKMTRWLAARQDPSLPSSERQKTVQHLASFDDLPIDILQEWVPKLVYQAENDGDEGTRNILNEVLLTLFEHNHPED